MTISGRAAKLLVAVLMASLVLNFAAVGFGGAMLGGGLVLRGLMQEATSAYPEQLRVAFRESVREHRRDIFVSLRALRQARLAQHAAITAERFDRTEAEATAAHVRETGLALVTLLQTILLDSIATLPDDVRREIPRAPLALGSLGAINDLRAVPDE